MVQNVNMPEYSPGQEAIRSMSDEVLALKPERSPLTNHTIWTSMSPDDVMSAIQEVPDLSGLLLEEGKSLLDPNVRRVNGIQHDLIVGEVEPNVVVLRAWGWDYDCQSSDSEDEDSEGGWTRQLDITFGYSDRYNVAQQLITATASTEGWPGPTPWISRVLKDLTSLEMGSGNQGHEHKSLNSSDESVIAFAGICRAMFDTKIDR